MMSFYRIVAAADGLKNCKVTAPGATGDSSDCLVNLPSVAADPNAIRVILQNVFGVLAAVAVLIIVLAGLTYSRSLGEPEKAAKARKTIIYTAVGLVIALSAEALVTLVWAKV